MDLKQLLKENEQRFGPGSCIEQLERAKKGADYDLIIGAVRLNFIMRVKTILMQEGETPESKVVLISEELNRYHMESHWAYNKISHLLT